MSEDLARFGVNPAPLRFSAYWLTDVAASVAVAMALIALRSLPRRTRVGASTRWGGGGGAARWFAGLSFTLYLTHWPLLIAAAALLPPESAMLRALAAGALPIAFAAALSPWIERRATAALRTALTPRGHPEGCAIRPLAVPRG